MARELQRIGPPGVGKTTRLIRDVAQAVEKYGSDRVMGVSFTRAAATEFYRKAEKEGVTIDPSMFGTFHSLAYHAIGSPPIADVPDGIKKWNEYCLSQGHPGDRLELDNGNDIDEPGWDAQGTADSPGQEHYNKTALWRSQLTPQEMWPEIARGWYQRWQAWMDREGFVDFTGMIEHVITSTDHAPGYPSVAFADEVQDWSKLEQKAFRHWGGQMETIVLTGDPDQSIYLFKGADPRVFLDSTPEFRSVLGQSFRVPRQVHAFAERWIKRSKGERLDRDYQPRDAEGKLEHSEARWGDPNSILKVVEPLLDSETLHYDENGKPYYAPTTVMVLASCSYMLDPFKRLLREKGVPFHNPYRTKRGDWNPLRSNGRGVSSIQRLLAYLRPRADVFGDQQRMWTGDDMQQWLEPLEAKGLLQIAKNKLGTLPVGRELTIDEIMAVLGEHAFAALEADPAWFKEHLLAGKAKTYDYPLAVAKRNAADLRKRPRLILGTIHSTKGGEADAVLLFPDLSVAGYAEWQGNKVQHDSVRRLFYVGATRAYDRLLLGAGSGYGVEWSA